MKQSFIGFNKNQYRSVKFDINKHILNIGDYIKFLYGANLDKPIIGKINQLYPQGVCINTDYGIYHSTWENITRYFQLKIPKKIKATNIKAADNISNVPVLDGFLDKLILKCKQLDNKIKIKDNRIDLSTRFTRTVIFSHKRKKVIFEIKDSTVNKINVTSSQQRNSSIKIKSGKLSSSALSLSFKKIKDLL